MNTARVLGAKLVTVDSCHSTGGGLFDIQVVATDKEIRFETKKGALEGAFGRAAGSQQLSVVAGARYREVFRTGSPSGNAGDAIRRNPGALPGFLTAILVAGARFGTHKRVSLAA